MTYTLLVKAPAVQDMEEAFEWYESKQIGLGVKFLDEVEGFYNRITLNPAHYQSHRNQRIAVMHRFPYKIVYEIEGDTIVVYAVYHDKRNLTRLTERE